jgi:hypothetical protein
MLTPIILSNEKEASIVLSNKKEAPPRAGCCGLEVNELGVDVPVGNPVDEVECDEDGWGEPHRPRVDVVAECLFMSAHATLHLKCDMGICERFQKVCHTTFCMFTFFYFGSVEGSKSG